MMYIEIQIHFTVLQKQKQFSSYPFSYKLKCICDIVIQFYYKVSSVNIVKLYNYFRKKKILRGEYH